MKINSKVKYGLRTMIEIAASTEAEGILQKDIAINQNISFKYLDPIISALKLKGLISNFKGKGSGYILTRPAEEISVLDIYTAFEQIDVYECINNLGYCERSLHDCKGCNFWQGFRHDFQLLLSQKNLAQVINETHYECQDLEHLQSLQQNQN